MTTNTQATHPRPDRGRNRGAHAMTDRPTNAPRGLEDVLAAHFVMWHPMDTRPGEWRCACGAKFGFSDSVIAHVATAIREWLTSEAVVEAAAKALRHRNHAAEVYNFHRADARAALAAAAGVV